MFLSIFKIVVNEPLLALGLFKIIYYSCHFKAIVLTQKKEKCYTTGRARFYENIQCHLINCVVPTGCLCRSEFDASPDFFPIM